MRIMNNSNITVEKNLQKARVTARYKQEQVAEILNCSSRCIGQLETNKSIGSISFIIALCNLYNITLNDLYVDFLNFKSLENQASIIEYKQLKEDYKLIIDNNILFLNSLQNKK